jgi:transcriptional regulator with XRE-family HTH domain
MEAQGLSQSEVARRMDLDRSAVTRILKGERGVKSGDVVKIATILKVSETEILKHVEPAVQVEHRGRKSRQPAAARHPGFGFMEGQVVFKNVTDMSGENEEYIVPPMGAHPLFGCMVGTLTLVPDVDYTAPADPDWGKVYDD